MPTHKMKTRIAISSACLFLVRFAIADAPLDENMTENIEFKMNLDVLQIMKEKGLATEGLTTLELGPMTVFQRNGRFVGYCVVESNWAPIPPEKLPLSDITKITYGDPDVPDIRFTIEDPKEIPLWVAAYRNHWVSSSKNLRIVPLGPDAGFQNTTIKVGSVAHGHGCHTGLYFYNGDKVIHVAGAHWDEPSKPGMLCPNEVLKALVCDQIKKEAAKSKPPGPEQSEPVGPSISPNTKE